MKKLMILMVSMIFSMAVMASDKKCVIEKGFLNKPYSKTEPTWGNVVWESSFDKASNKYVLTYKVANNKLVQTKEEVVVKAPKMVSYKFLGVSVLTLPDCGGFSDKGSCDGTSEVKPAEYALQTQTITTHKRVESNLSDYTEVDCKDSQVLNQVAQR